jgi:hypothetical protein
MGWHQVKNHINGNIYQSDETAYRMGEIFASYSSDKGLISRIHKKLRKLNTKRINNSVNKSAN